MSPSPDPDTSGDGPSGGPAQPDGPQRDPSRMERLRGRLPSQGRNVWFVVLGAWMLFMLGQLWYQSTQVPPIPYSRFLEYQREGRVSDLVIGSDQITGKIVEPEEGQPERFHTVRVDPSWPNGWPRTTSSSPAASRIRGSAGCSRGSCP